MPQPSSKLPTTPRPRTEPPAADRTSPTRGWPGVRRATVLMVAGMVLAAVLIGRQFVGPPKFPAHVGPAPPPDRTASVAPRLAPPPKSPSLANLALNTPTRLPGLAEVRDASDPALSADMKVIVYVVDRGARGGRDLMTASRDEAWKSFQQPVPVDSANTPAGESAPTLSREGTELFFTRDGKILRATRPASSAPFGPAEPVSLPGVDPDSESLDALQMASDNLHLIFRRKARSSPDASPRYAIAFRAAEGEAFETLSEARVWSAWAPNRLTADLLRCFVTDGPGLSISSRIGQSDSFGLPGLIQTTTADRIGPIVGPFWIAPKEDLIVYSSPGRSPASAKTGRTESQPPASSKPTGLWMVRFR